MLQISGLQKTTLLDYPGHVASTIFLGGCNFSCPFCHNSDLIDGPAPDGLTEEEVLAFLNRRAAVLEGVCITGGEPTLHPGLESFIRRVRETGLLVKLDTNGYRPDVLKRLMVNGLIDYAAMDIKAGKSGYARAAGCSGLDLSLIDESILCLLKGQIPFEFRTTVVRELHSEKDFNEIGPWIKGAPRYYLQNFTDSEYVPVHGFSACTKEELLGFAEIMAPFAGEVTLRGID